MVLLLQAFSERLHITNKFCLNNKADCTVGLFENYELGRLEQPREVFVGRWVSALLLSLHRDVWYSLKICDGARHLIDKYDVRKRYFIGKWTYVTIERWRWEFKRIVWLRFAPEVSCLISRTKDTMVFHPYSTSEGIFSGKLCSVSCRQGVKWK